MLILTRRKGERIVINHTGGETTIIEVQKATPSSVKLGVNAPKSVEIHRAEQQQRLLNSLMRLLRRSWVIKKLAFIYK